MIYKKKPAKYLHDQTNRYALGSIEQKPLVIFGLNPSTATDILSDRTIKRVEKLADELNFDSWMMLNLCSLIETNPSLLPATMSLQSADNNLAKVKEVLSLMQNPILCAAWGNGISDRPYFKNCLAAIARETNRVHGEWHSFGPLTKSGHPWHPLYLRKANRYLHPLDMKKYLEKHF